MTRVMERRWFALKNFHMLFYEDAHNLNYYLHHWDGGQSMEGFFQEVWKAFPWYMKLTAWFARYIPRYRKLVEAITRAQLKKLAHMEHGTMRWIRSGDEGRVKAFYGSLEAYMQIPDWDEDLPLLDHNQKYIRLEHGYDEKKTRLDMQDLQKAAAFRGGQLRSERWDGDLHANLGWTCCQNHSFNMSPHAVLKGGHWCMDCISPPWNYELLAKENPFAAQVL
jgi:hypothetical protein